MALVRVRYGFELLRGANKSLAGLLSWRRDFHISPKTTMLQRGGFEILRCRNHNDNRVPT